MSLLGPQQRNAVAYYRHSAEDKQENSVPIQREHSQKFAREYHVEIIHEEADEGRTGLLADRPGFRQLFENWVLNAAAPPFDLVLVYDVSRWGRFQDQDEAAYYEFICRQHGKEVIYVSRGFPPKENPLIMHLQTSIERYMAAEYSRQLSDKVYCGCVKVSQAGYSAGGMACYGMGRLLLDVNKRPVRILRKGEHKSIDNERVTFVPLDDATTQSVKNIFYLFVVEGKNEYEIAAILNGKKVFAPNGGKWHEQKILHILRNETYIGNRIYNKTSNRLKKGKHDNPSSEWVVCKNAFPAIVDAVTFLRAQERIFWMRRSQWKRGIYMLSRARTLLKRELRDFFSRESMSEQEVETITRRFPVVLSVALRREQYPTSWCFTIPESMKKYSNVVGVSVVLDTQEVMDRCFVIPTRDFGVGGFKFFSENDVDYQKYYLIKDKVETAIWSMVSRSVN